MAIYSIASTSSTSKKVNVSCNCKKGCGTRCSIYCYNKDYDCSNLKTLADKFRLAVRGKNGLASTSERRLGEGDAKEEGEAGGGAGELGKRGVKLMTVAMEKGLSWEGLWLDVWKPQALGS